MATANASSISISWNGTPLPALPLSGVTLNRAATLEDVTTYGVSAQVFANAGLEKRQSLKLQLLYNDAASNVDALFAGNIGTSGTLLITWDSTPKTSSMTAFVGSYERNGTVGKMTKATVEFQPSGTVTEV